MGRLQHRVNMDITIAGIGAMGSLFGVMLQSVARQYGLRLQMYGHWGQQIAALNNGLKVISEAGTTSVWRLSAVDNPEKLQAADLLIVLVKSWQTQQTAAELAYSLKRNGVVLTLQNGLGNEKILQAAFPGFAVVTGITTCGAYLQDAGVLQKAGSGKVLIAENTAASAQMQLLQAALSDAGCAVEITRAIECRRWGKLIINAAINPLSALYNLPNGALLSDKTIAEQMERITKEAVKVAQAAGVDVDESQTWQAVCEICRNTAHNFSSMLQDVRRQRPTEIEAITGQLLQHAKQHQISVPENEAVYLKIRDIEAAYHLNRADAK